jgi:hypothetical protein
MLEKILSSFQIQRSYLTLFTWSFNCDGKDFVAHSLPEFIPAISAVHVAHSLPESTPAISGVPVDNVAFVLYIWKKGGIPLKIISKYMSNRNCTNSRG